MKIKIATRKSKLALWQTYHIQDLLQGQGLETEIITFDTKGDQILDRSLSKIGSKGVFTQELEAALLTGEVDIAVHSAKDMQSDLGPDLEIIAFTEREVVNDVLAGFDLSKTIDKDIVIGTSSTRRVAFLKHFYPQVSIVDMRGNLQTRFQKLKDGTCDALMLAYAGVHRMEMDDRIIQKLDLDEFTPAVGQGSVAIESAVTLDSAKKEAIRLACNHVDTEYCLKAERAYLKYLEGGCSIPVFGNCTLENNQLLLKGGIVSLDGKQLLKKTLSADIAKAEQLGIDLAKKIISLGGDKILEEIKRNS